MDQDALNEACYGHTLILNNKWNFTPKEQGNFYEHMTSENRAKLEAITEPKIVHFVGSKMKPWDFCVGDERFHKIIVNVFIIYNRKPQMIFFYFFF